MNNQGILLKEARIRYGLTQKELAGNNMDRTIIAHIENGTSKYPLSKEIAIKIGENINNAVQGMNVEPFDYTYFFDNDLYVVTLKVKSIIQSLEKNLSINNFIAFDMEFDRLTPIFMEYTLPEYKAAAFELAGLNAIKQSNYFKAYLLFNRSIDSAVSLGNTDLIINLSSQSARALIYLNRYEEALTVYNTIMGLYREKVPNKTLFKIYNNRGHCYKQLCYYDFALLEFNKCLEIGDKSDKRSLSELYCSISLCYSRQHKYGEAILLLEKALYDIAGDADISLPIYLNILGSYLNSCNDENIIKYIEIITTLLNYISIENKYFAHAYYELGNSYMYLKNIELAEITFIKALSISRGNNDFLNQIKIITKLLQIYYSSKNLMKIDLITADICHLIKNIDYEVSTPLINQLISIYADLGDVDKIKHLLYHIKKIGEEKNEKENHTFIIDSGNDAVNKYRDSYKQYSKGIIK